MAKVTINHVFSNDVPSQIFDDLMRRFEGAGHRFTHLKSVQPLAGALVRHYHRPNLESRLIRPAVVTVHHDLSETDEWLQFRKFERQYREADLIICLNTSQIEFLKAEGIPHTTLIPHGYDAALLGPVRRVFDGVRKISIGVFSGRYPRKVKGEAHLHELMKRLDPDKFKFLFIGQDRSVDARQARLRGFEVRSYENVPYCVLASAYREIDILLIASAFEGGPASIPEAVATATPVISTPVGMANDYVTEGVTGHFLRLIPTEDACLLSRLHANPVELERLFDGARQRADSATEWSSIVARHEDAYQTIIRSAVGPYEQ